MTRIRMVVLLGMLAFGLLPVLCLAKEPAASRSAEAPPATALQAQAPAAPTATACPAVSPAASEQDLANLHADLRASEDRLRKAIADSKPSGWEKLLPAILGLIGVLVGGGINIWLQRRQSAASEKADRAMTAFEAQTKIIDYRSRQAHEFYHPLLLMLQRSSGVRRQLCDHLAKKNPVRFQMVQESNGEHLFIFGPAGEPPVRFRLIEAMYELATQHVETLPMVNEIVAIGEKMSALIHDKGGLAVSSSADLTVLLGKYLAHYSILREVATKAIQPDQLQGIEYNVLYPNELDDELKNGISYLQDVLKAWSTFLAKLWNEAMPGNPMPSMTALVQNPPACPSRP